MDRHHQRIMLYIIIQWKIFSKSLVFEFDQNIFSRKKTYYCNYNHAFNPKYKRLKVERLSVRSTNIYGKV